jgi:DNA-binding NarL/FixJ family response regulator
VIVATQPPSEPEHLPRAGASPVTVLVADDQPVFRDVAARLLAATPGFVQVGEADSGVETLRLAAELQPALVLLDVRMPGMNGVETARRLVAAHPEIVVVLISTEAILDLPLALVAAGTVTYLRKQDLSSRALLALWAARDRAGRHAPDA